jgi:hypothetical protein
LGPRQTHIQLVFSSISQEFERPASVPQLQRTDQSHIELLIICA